MSTPNRTKQVFDATASTYDADRSRLIPGCDELYHWTIELIHEDTNCILELGAGSGLLTFLLCKRCPNASIHLIDFSAPMLELAKHRLGEDRRITYEQADYVTADWPADLDAIASSLSIHHLDDSEKKIVFRKAYQSLRPGGVFVNAEQVAGPTPEQEDRYKRIWLEQVRASGATEEQIEASLYRQREDRCASTEQQLMWLREAGFADADCWYKNNRFAVLAGSRSR